MNFAQQGQWVFICYRIMDTRNRNVFQKAFRISKKVDTDILAVERVGKKSDLDKEGRSVTLFPISRWLYPVGFPIWAAFKVWKGHGRKAYVYTDWHNTSLLTGFVLTMFGATWIADMWDDPKKRLLTWAESRRQVPWFRKFYHRLQWRLIPAYLKRAKVVITCVPKLDETYSLKKEKIIVHTNGVDLEHTKVNIPFPRNQIFTLLYVGPVEEVRLRHIKGIIRSVHREIGTFEIRLVGAIQDMNLVRDIKGAAPKGVSAVATGWRNHLDVLSEIEASDVCLLPYPNVTELREYRPIKLFEYMAMGKPVVASRLPGIEQVVDHGETGFLYMPEDTEEAARIIRKIKENPDLLKAVGARAKEEMKKYDWSCIIEGIFSQLQARIG